MGLMRRKWNNIINTILLVEFVIAFFIALFWLFLIPAMPQETCATKLEQLNKLDPASQKYKDLYHKYLNECSGQERLPRQACIDLRKACQNRQLNEAVRVKNCYAFRDNCQDKR